jgi:hypothetical protein
MQVRQLVAVAPCLAVLAASVPPAEASDKVDKKVVAFFRAVKEGNLAGIQEAVKKKVNLNILDENENTALCIAAAAGKADMVDALLKAGAKVDEPNGIGVTPLMLAARNGYGDLARALLAAGASADAVDERGRTLLFHSVRGGNVVLVEAVLAASAKVDAADENRRTPLMLAAEDGRVELVALLLKAGAAVDARDLKSGYTPLMCAALAGHDDVVKALLRAGADATLKSNSGETAQQLAELSQHPSTAELLKAKPTPAPRKPAARSPRAKPTSKPAPKP